MIDKHAKILVAGHRGMVGSALCRLLDASGYSNIIKLGRDQADLTCHTDTLAFFQKTRPDYVVDAAARVGGIIANKSYPADFLYDNLMIQSNVMQASFLTDVGTFLFLGSSCIYPKFAPQPITEEDLLTGPLEPTNEAYAIAKIAGLKLCDAYATQHKRRFISAMPCNLYGFGDNFHPQNSHVIPGLMHRFHLAKTNNEESVTCWGSGKPLREFLFVEDLADALLFILSEFDGPGFLNVGVGEDVSIRQLAEKIAGVVGYTGLIQWDTSKPDGTPRKILSVDKIHQLGWRHKTSLDDGLQRTYDWYLDNLEHIRR